MFYLEKSIICIAKSVATASNADMIISNNAESVWKIINVCISLLPSLVALWVAWTSQKFNAKQKLVDLKIRYCDKYINDYIRLRQCAENMEYKAIELIIYSNNEDKMKEKLCEFQTLREQLVIISNEAVYSSGMLAKLYRENVDVENFQRAYVVGRKVTEACNYFIDKIRKYESYEKYIEENPDELTRKMAEICDPYKKKITESINEAQNKILNNKF